MSKIITISRQFGSGGRELGKRLADELHLPIYDHEIIEQLAAEHELTPEYIESLSEQSVRFSYQPTIGHRFTVQYPAADQQLKLITAQEQLIRKLAEHDCIIVGRAADVLLADRNPFNIFVYADMTSRINRCMERENPGENLSANQLKNRIRKIDRQRASYRSLFAETPWGRKENYTLCINTSECTPKAIAPALAVYINAWFS